ncbi:hypothetical protein BS47DRAFT_1145701 [Hydnum rufescens UP504]|uniref:Uncharacterized protein n=1 Tax=Hydnum rufescens UP504 TaxID=1448309 RepID=A0A9P6ATZ0_9AGAM|nr:hypothetical protein BS47DRAFT_1145701 [Hydnum rufescens UP504]
MYTVTPFSLAIPLGPSRHIARARTKTTGAMFFAAFGGGSSAISTLNYSSRSGSPLRQSSLFSPRAASRLSFAS